MAKIKKLRVPQIIQQALDESGQPYKIVLGKRHHKIMMADRLVGVLPLGIMYDAYGIRTAHHNTASQIRRMARKLQVAG